MGHSKGVYSGRRHWGFFHLCAHANAAAFVGPPYAGEQRESVPLARNASRLCAAVVDVASCARWLLPIELVFPGSNDPSGRALFAIRYSLWDAHVPIPGGNSGRDGGCDRTVFCGNIQPGCLGRRTGPIRFRLDWALHHERRSRRAFHSLIL